MTKDQVYKGRNANRSMSEQRKDDFCGKDCMEFI